MNNKTELVQLSVGVKILLKNSEGKYLLVRRSPEKYPEVGNYQWDIVGGRIDPGLPLLENLKREIKEEIGMDLETEPRLIAAQDILRIPGRHVIRLSYVGEANGKPKINNEEHTEFKWFTIGEMKQLEGLDIYFKKLLDKGLFE